MLFNIRGDKIEITESIKEYIDKRIGRLDKYFRNPGEMKANVKARLSGINQVIEVTIPIKKGVLRAEDRDKDLYAAIDKVTEKLERQIRKNKTKIMNHRNVKNTFNDVEIEEVPDNKKVVKRKLIETKPMSEEEAILQMELIDHDFFIFKDAEDDSVAVAYKRNDKQYGIIKIK
jgi:putative sigma-54 modulation protein